MDLQRGYGEEPTDDFDSSLDEVWARVSSTRDRRRSLRRRARNAGIYGAGVLTGLLFVWVAFPWTQPPSEMTSSKTDSVARVARSDVHNKVSTAKGSESIAGAAPLVTDDGLTPTKNASLSASGRRHWRFRDGSAVTISNEAEVHVRENEKGVFAVQLDRGEIDVAVTPGGPRVWKVSAGQAEVRVVGTQFSVKRRGPATEVSVSKGIVEVRARELPNGVKRLVAGDRLVVGELKEESLSEQTVPAETGRPDTVFSKTGSTTACSLECSGALGAVPRAEVRNALLTVDELRRERSFEEASRLLCGVIAGDGRVQDKAWARFLLGRMLLRQFERYGDASEHLSCALSLGLPVSVREDALGLRVKALVHAGRGSEAKRAAEKYRRLYPDGSHREVVEKWLSE